MNCDRSHKRHLLTSWGMCRLAEGVSYKFVTGEIARRMRKTTREVEEFCRLARVAAKLTRGVTSTPKVEDFCGHSLAENLLRTAGGMRRTGSKRPLSS